ncbi:hypothetical protein P7B02_03285 [Caulobacter segnis]|uniref:hypothetical protein n=1 Tax=Caulobacter segnis TaxID=88688 RepID=UPI00240EEAA1|nr:hypothetical protein [Caulobacter segnis]MDG2520554.1 hypothetical protein [Caulobacter segnis]
MISDREDHIAWRFVGIALAFVLAFTAFLIVRWTDGIALRRETAAALRVSGMIVWWRREGWEGLLGAIAIALPMFTVPGAFGLRYRRLVPNLTAAGRILVVLGCVVVLVVQALTALAIGGRRFGVATPTEAQWFSGGALKARQAWEQATEIVGGCRTDRTSDEGPSYGVEYTVRFVRGREARMVDQPLGAATWSARLKSIDDRLTAAGVVRSVESDPECLAHYMRGMTGEDRAVFTYLLRPVVD